MTRCLACEDDDRYPHTCERIAGGPLTTVAAHDPVHVPSHYASGSVECIEAIKASMTPEAFRGYLKGNVQKYMWRYEKKVNPAEDLRKAKVYLDWLIAEVE